MTYCIAVSVDAGLVLTSDSRTNAGINDVSTYGKMHVFATHEDRKLVLLSAGNLATTKAVVEQLRRDLHPCRANRRRTAGRVFGLSRRQQHYHLYADPLPANRRE